jgi:hypothetical protein
MSKDLLKEKFKDVSHKWLLVNKEELLFQKIMRIIKDEKDSYRFKEKEDVIKLGKLFFKKEFAFFKYLGTKGSKSNFKCNCQLITEGSIKIDFFITFEELYCLPLLEGTPKSLKLFKEDNRKSSKSSSNWKKPDDGFHDDIEVPLDYEFTEDGYYLYKGYIEDIKQNKIQKKSRNWCRIPTSMSQYLK